MLSQERVTEKLIILLFFMHSGKESQKNHPYLQGKLFDSLVFCFQLLLHQRGQRLSLSLYKIACAALKDDFEGVRIAALKLIWTLAHLYPEEMIELPTSGEEKESIRLVDDGFAQICDMVCTIW